MSGVFRQFFVVFVACRSFFVVRLFLAVGFRPLSLVVCRFPALLVVFPYLCVVSPSFSVHSLPFSVPSQHAHHPPVGLHIPTAHHSAQFPPASIDEKRHASNEKHTKNQKKTRVILLKKGPRKSHRSPVGMSLGVVKRRRQGFAGRGRSLAGYRKNERMPQLSPALPTPIAIWRC